MDGVVVEALRANTSFNRDEDAGCLFAIHLSINVPEEALVLLHSREGEGKGGLINLGHSVCVVVFKLQLRGRPRGQSIFFPRPRVKGKMGSKVQ